MSEAKLSAAITAAESKIVELTSEAKDLLVEMIRYKSLAGCEDDLQAYLADWLKSRGMPATLVQADDELENDRNYSHYERDGHHAPNLHTSLPSSGSGRSLILNSHTDVVPAENPELYIPKVDGDIITGRGAADAKGQVVTFLLAMLAVKQAGIRLAGACDGVAVVEEEIGGNGTLAWCRQTKPYDCAVVLEPTVFGIHPANRGAVWFKIVTEGIPTHMGRWWEGQSAFENLEAILEDVRKWDAKLVAESKGVPLFPDDPSPVHVNVGIVRSGDWPAKVPASAEAEGGVSFLPNKNLAAIMSEMTEVVESAAASRGFKATVSFEKLKNEAYATPADHPAVMLLADCANQVRGQADVSGFLASCDARLVFHRANIPTIVFGPGDLLMAHSDIECIDFREVVEAARILANFIIRWCGIS